MKKLMSVVVSILFALSLSSMAFAQEAKKDVAPPEPTKVEKAEKKADVKKAKQEKKAAKKKAKAKKDAANLKADEKKEAAEKKADEKK